MKLLSGKTGKILAAVVVIGLAVRWAESIRGATAKVSKGAARLLGRTEG